jgi:hypothetical protein
MEFTIKKKYFSLRIHFHLTNRKEGTLQKLFFVRYALLQHFSILFY